MGYLRRLRFWLRRTHRGGFGTTGSGDPANARSLEKFDRSLEVERYKNAKAYDDLRDALADMIKARNARHKDRRP